MGVFPLNEKERECENQGALIGVLWSVKDKYLIPLK